MSDAPYELPDGWTWKGLGKVVEILDGKRIPVNLTEREKRKGKIPYYGATGQVGWIDDYLFDEELLLLGEDGAPFLDPDKHKAYIISGKSWVNNHAHVLKALNLTLNAYVCHYLNTFDYHDFVNGTTRLKLTQGAMREIPVPLAPLPEQRRIVAKIEQLFAESRTAREALERVPALLKRFRQSILAAAFRGQLTERDPNDEPASALLERVQRLPKSSRLRKSETRKSEETRAHPSPDTSDLPELPEGWRYSLLEPLLSAERKGIKTGPFGSSLKKEEHQADGIPVLGIENIGLTRFISGSKIHISHEKARQLSQYDVQPRDVIISRAGTVGLACVVPNSIGEARMSSNIMRVVFAENGMLPEFFCYLLNGSPVVLNQIAEASRGSTRDFINQPILMSIRFPLAPLAEQRRIVARIEALFAQADAVERAVAIARQRADKIDQAILSRAFRGEL